MIEELRFLKPETARLIAETYGTSAYVYDLKTLRTQAAAAKAFPNAYGLTVRFAIKACPNATILRLFDAEGLHFDASSGHEVSRALRAGVAAEKISLSTQEYPEDFDALHAAGIRFNACSLHQLERFGEAHPGECLGLRFNPGLGSGGTSRTNVGGPASSFGIWHEDLEQVQALVERHQLKVVRIHTHIGSGSDPAVWQRVAGMSLNIVQAFPEVQTLNLGGGYKVGRMAGEPSTDLQEVGMPVKAAFEVFAKETGRRLQLEIEPGTFLVANAGALLARVQDVTSTGERGYRFLKLDLGMTDILRPSLYGAQHPIVVIPQSNADETEDYVVVGHCCESGDLLTPAPNEPEQLAPRRLARAAIGDLCVIEGAGAYCASMCAVNYNAFPQAPEILLDAENRPHLIRHRQHLDQMLENELRLDF